METTKDKLKWYNSLLSLSALAVKLGISLNTAKSHDYPIASMKGNKPLYDLTEILKNASDRAKEKNSSKQKND